MKKFEKIKKILKKLKNEFLLLLYKKYTIKLKMIVCEFCKKEYSNIHILNNHQKTANFCLKIQNNIKNTSNYIEIKKENEETLIDNDNLFNCEFCQKEFNTKFKLNSHMNNCKQREVEIIRKEYELKLDSVKKEYELKLESIKKENEVNLESVKKEYKKEIQLKDDYIKTLKEQVNIYIEKTASGSTSISTTNNNIINSINIKEEQFNKYFESLKPMLSRNIKSSMEQINYYQMLNNVEPMDKYFIKSFVDNFKDYMFTTDSSRKTIIIKLENGDSQKIKAVEFILNCFKIAEPELIRLFRALDHHIRDLAEMEEITPEEHLLYLKNLNDLKQFVFEQKSNKLVNKIATELVNRGKIMNSKKITDNKVIENEILRLH